MSGPQALPLTSAGAGGISCYGPGRRWFPLALEIDVAFGFALTSPLFVLLTW